MKIPLVDRGTAGDAGRIAAVADLQAIWKVVRASAVDPGAGAVIPYHHLYDVCCCEHRRMLHEDGPCWICGCPLFVAPLVSD